MNAPIIYLDHQATTPPDPRVLEAMQPWLREPANPHASNAAGRRAAMAVEHAREQVAHLINANPEEITFTSNATEATNIVLRSFARPSTSIAASMIEHPSVTETLKSLSESVNTIKVPVDSDGIVDLTTLEDKLTPAVALVSVMAVNNEIGTIQPIDIIGGLCRYLEVPFFSDIVQAVGRIPIDVKKSAVSFASLSSHKIYGPQGVGALYTESDFRSALRPIATGGGQERGLRPGTVPTALCVGFGAACDLLADEWEDEARRTLALSDLFLNLLSADVPEIRVNGSTKHRIPHNLNVAIPGVDADTLLALIPNIAMSTGSACSAGAHAPSHVLRAIGLNDNHLECSIRIGFGRTTTTDDVQATVAAIISANAVLKNRVMRSATAGQ